MLCSNLMHFSQNELKVNWEVEKSALEESKNEAEKKYNDINEQVIDYLPYEYAVDCR